MGKETILGLCLIVLGGICQAMFMLPAKWAKAWRFEHIWLTFASFSYLLLPWLVVILCVPRVWEIFEAVPKHDLFWMGLYATCWALAALGFGIGVSAIGMSIGFAIIFGLAAFVGALIPLIGERVLFHGKLSLVVCCLLLMLVGVALCSHAGKWKEARIEEEIPGRRYFRGVLCCIASGLLGAAGNLGFFAGAGVVRIAYARGLSAFAANSVILAYLCLFMFTINAGYATILLFRSMSFSLLWPNNFGLNHLLSALMGILWMAGFLLYGVGAHTLGPLGLSLGWGVFMCTVVVSANAVGILSGEWRLAPSAARRQLAIGLAFLVIAIAGLAYSNT